MFDCDLLAASVQWSWNLEYIEIWTTRKKHQEQTNCEQRIYRSRIEKAPCAKRGCHRCSRKQDKGLDQQDQRIGWCRSRWQGNHESIGSHAEREGTWRVKETRPDWNSACWWWTAGRWRSQLHPRQKNHSHGSTARNQRGIFHWCNSKRKASSQKWRNREVDWSARPREREAWRNQKIIEWSQRSLQNCWR